MVKLAIVTVILAASCGRVRFADVLDGAVDAPVGFGPFKNAHVMPNVNSTSREFGASASRDELELYFTSNRNGTFVVYRATRANRTDDFGPPQIALFGGNGFGGEAAVARDDVDLYLGVPNGASHTHRTDTQSPWAIPTTDPVFTGFSGVDFGGHDLRMVMQNTTDQLYEAQRPDLATAFSSPAMIVELVGYRQHQNYPTMTDDGFEIFYQAYDQPNGIGTILTARRPAIDQPFGPATPALSVGPTVSIGDPGISADGRTLYYGSDENAPPGTSDLWVAERDPL